MTPARSSRDTRTPRPFTRFAALCAIGSAVALTGCADAGDDGPEVVVTTNILGDVVHEIVGDEVSIEVLMPAGSDPHSFEISARDAADVENAELIVANGLGLEEGIAQIVAAAEQDGVPVLEAAAAADPLLYSDGASAGTEDPHFWTDPARMLAAVYAIEQALLEHVPRASADGIRTGADEYRDELRTLDAWMTECFASLPDDRRRLVTNHHVFGYLAERYDFEVIGAVVPSGTTLASPSASDLDELATAITDAGVPAIFADSSQPDRLAQVLAEQAGLDVAVVGLHTESLSTDDDADSYLDMMRSNTEAIVAALKP
ncbi:zinc ABC transporter substrate-binding protein AztC [Okibacterium endophyticum]